MHEKVDLNYINKHNKNATKKITTTITTKIKQLNELIHEKLLRNPWCKS